MTYCPRVRAIPVFVAIVTALAIAVSVAVALTGGPHGPLGALRFATMLLPAAAAAIAGTVTNEPPRIDWSRMPVAYLPVALFLIPGIMHAAMLPAMRAVAGRLPWSAHPTWPAIVANAGVGLAVVSLLALFEEIGWRGWLQPRLVNRFGAVVGIACTSAIWASWHVPFVLSGILDIDGVSRAQTLYLVPLGVAGAGLVIGWLWMRTESIWIVALAHGAMNNWGQFAFKYMHAAPNVDLAPVLLAGTVAVLATGAAALWSLR